MKRKIFIIITIIILSIIYSPFCFAESTVQNTTNTNKIILEDDAQLFTTEQEKQLLNNMKQLAEYGNIAVKTTSAYRTNSTAEYAKNYYNAKFAQKNGSVFIIDMVKRNIYIYSYGENYKVINSSKANTITDNVYLYATKEQYYECTRQALIQMHTVLQGGQVPEPMKYISNALISIMLSLILSFLIFRKLTRNKEIKFTELIKDNDNTFKHTIPTIRKTGAHREYSPQSSNSFGSSGGGGRTGGSSRRWRRPQLLKYKEKNKH